ncbi:MAG: hypothetical protein QXX64_02050 [Nitrososphaera sp.]
MQMNGSRRSVQELSKPLLLGLATALVIGVVTPLIIPHVTHPSMVFHVALHVVGVTIAAFLSMVSFLAYSRNPSTRMFLIALGFTTLVLAEFFHVLQASGMAAGLSFIPALNIELPHIVLLIMLVFFGLGVLKVNK